MGRTGKSVMKVGLAIMLMVVGLSGICLAQVSCNVEQGVLEQK